MGKILCVTISEREKVVWEAMVWEADDGEDSVNVAEVFEMDHRENVKDSSDMIHYRCWSVDNAQ